jgi:Skp family chaperone for outer membrane proteins
MRNKNVGIWFLAALFCSTVLWFVGCNHGGDAGAASEASPPAPSVGVVNLDNVFRDLGWSDKLKNNTLDYQKQLGNELSQVYNNYNAQIIEQKKAFMPSDSVKPTPSQQETLNRMGYTAQQAFGQLQNQAKQQLQNYQMEAIKRYRDALMPTVRETAQAKKMTVALTQTDGVMFVDPSVDLSNAVVDSARAHQPLLTDVPMPSLPAAPSITGNGPATLPAATLPAVPTTRP